MVRTNNNVGVRLTPSLESNWLFNGQGSFGKVVDCPADRADIWQEVTDEFKAQWEAEERKRLGIELATNVAESGQIRPL